MDIEKIRFNSTDYAIILRKSLRVERSTFFTKDDNSMQIGVIKHEAGYVERPHIHRKPNIYPDIQQVLYIQKGIVAIDFFDDKGIKVGEATLKEGDIILRMFGGHAIRVIEDLACFTVKQGPFAGDKEDKIELTGRG